MQWERRKPLWPRVAALGLLFVLALAAPRSWQSKSSRQAPPAETLMSQLLLPTQPSVGPPEPEPEPEPITISRPEQLPARHDFDFETLLQVRDLLLAVVDQLPSPQQAPPEQATLPTARPASVRVTNANDRLAMVPRRSVASRKRPLPSLSEENAEKEVANFAAILLEASRSPQPIRPTRRTEHRLALRPTPSKNSAAALSTEPPPEASPPIVSQPAESQKGDVPPIQLPLLKHRPLALIEQLESFSASSRGAAWSQQVLVELRQLTETSSGQRSHASEILDRLEQLVVLGLRQTEEPTSLAYHDRWQQATQALDRRLLLWRLLMDPDQPKITGASPTHTAKIVQVLHGVAQLLNENQQLGEGQNREAWREYLLLDRIADATSEGLSSPSLTRIKLAQEVLSRMADPQLTDAQIEFLALAPLVQLHQELRVWAAGKVNLETLAALIERYESGRKTRYAAVIAQLQQRLKWSENPQIQALANRLDQHYRGANMRLAMSNDLFNRMLPKQQPTVTPVRDQIAGAKVRGSARTTTRLHVRLMPDPDAWHFALEATGKVYSDTRSDTWPARIRNAAKMQYQGRKEISIDEQGLHVTRAQASAQGRNELLGVESQLDPIPIVGHLLRNMARQKHKKARPTALRQAKSKVVRQVKQRMDATLDQKLEGFEQKFRDKILAPIEQLALLAEPLDMHTTQQRAVMQLRLANTGQLAAHTLRPLAPSDSVLSVQMHETALNNAILGLGLNGRRMTMLELFDYLAHRFGLPDATPPEDLPRRAVIKFASRDALRVQCDGDRLELVLSVDELAHRRDKIKNFQIHVHYRPVVNGLSVKLVRDGTLQFSGRRLKTGPRVVLHSIMGKLLVKDQEINLVNAKLMLDPRFGGLMVTQLVIEDGWIGLALGPASPRRTAWRASTPEVLSTPFVR